jgi:hypothetical protein
MEYPIQPSRALLSSHIYGGIQRRRNGRKYHTIVGALLDVVTNDELLDGMDGEVVD